MGETLQMIYLNKECPQDIVHILYNQKELNANSNNDSNEKLI